MRTALFVGLNFFMKVTLGGVKAAQKGTECFTFHRCVISRIANMVIGLGALGEGLVNSWEAYLHA